MRLRDLLPAPPPHLPIPRFLIKRGLTGPTVSMPVDVPEGPTTAETVAELKNRLAKELYQLQLDLQSGGRIAGKPCDCLSKKHNFGVIPCAEELIPMDSNPVYGEIIAFMQSHEADFQRSAIAQHEPKYYQAMTPIVRDLRKRVME